MLLGAFVLFSIVLALAIWIVRGRAQTAVLSQLTIEPDAPERPAMRDRWVPAPAALPADEDKDDDEEGASAATRMPEPALERTQTAFAAGCEPLDARSPLPAMDVRRAHAPRQALAPRSPRDPSNATPARMP
jgi:hypothetical protein